jgi:hypothetical protein
VRCLLVAIGLSTVVLALAPTTGVAQLRPEVAEGRARALAGEFGPANASLEAALGRGDLSRDDLIAIYEARVFMHFANSDSAPMRADLARIAAIDPTHTFDADYYPAGVTDVFRQIVGERAGALALDAEAVVLASGEFEVRAEVQNDPGDLTRSVRVHARGAEQEWQSGTDDLRIDPDGATTGEFYAEAVGPGGAILARRGSESAPVPVDLLTVTETEGGGVPVWVWIAGGVGVAAVLAVVIILVATSGGVSEDMQPSGPMVRFGM